MEESVSSVAEKRGLATFELASRLLVKNGNLRETTEERYEYIARAGWSRSPNYSGTLYIYAVLSKTLTTVADQGHFENVKMLTLQEQTARKQ